MPLYYEIWRLVFCQEVSEGFAVLNELLWLCVTRRSGTTPLLEQIIRSGPVYCDRLSQYCFYNLSFDEFN